MGRGDCLSVRLSVPCLNITRERIGLGSPNLAGLKPITRVTRDYLEVKKSKAEVTRRINAYTVYAQYVLNGKAYELQIWYTDEAGRPTSATSSVTSKVKGQGRKVT